jgi:hypothetical protein
MTHFARLVVPGLLMLTASSAAAQSVPATDALGTGSVPHVRGVDPLAREVLRTASARSPTVARLISLLDQSDLIVNVGTGRLPGNVNGQAGMIATTPSVRYVRIVLRIPRSTPALMEVLGHELRHAVEIAAMSSVRDSRSLAAAYRRIGVERARGGYFETDAAVETGKLVAREVAWKRR